MAVLVDEARWPAHGRLWAHLVSDTSYEELHAFAATAGIPRRGFDHDHYDVPAERLDALVAAGAQPVGGRELVRRLVASGLRVLPRDRTPRTTSEAAVPGAAGPGGPGPDGAAGAADTGGPGRLP